MTTEQWSPSKRNYKEANMELVTHSLPVDWGESAALEVSRLSKVTSRRNDQSQKRSQ